MRDQCILFLRYNTKAPKPNSQCYYNYSDIANAIGCSVTTVRSVCLRAINDENIIRPTKGISKTLESTHTKFLTKHTTLKKWVGRSLDERASLFSAKFPDKSITGGKLWHLYRKHGIKYKCVAAKKFSPK